MATDKADLLRQLDGAEYKGDLLQQWGETALKKALISHLSEAYPVKKELVDDLLNHYLSHYYLKKVAETLFDHGLVTVARVGTIDHDIILHHTDGLRLILDNLAVLISLGGTKLEKIDAKVWKNSFKTPPVTELEGVVCDRRMLETWKGFRAGMHAYALQAAGLIYVNSLSNGPDFWEEYKQYMILLEPEELAKEKEEAQKFKTEMQLTLEAIPGYSGCTMVVSNPGEEQL